MLDAFSALKDQLHDPKFDDKYSADQVIVSAEFASCAGSGALTVVFPAWHVPEWFFKRLKLQLLKHDSNVLIYNFNPQILSDDPIVVKDSFEYLALAISEDVRELCHLKHFTTVDLLGFSLGNIALCITAEKLDSFNKVTMLVPGSELAVSLWNGWRTRRLRDIYKKEGYKLADVQKEWAELAPESHVATLKNHPVQVVLAKKDRFIPYIYGKEFVDKLQAVDPLVTFSSRPFGHLATMLSYGFEQ